MFEYEAGSVLVAVADSSAARELRVLTEPAIVDQRLKYRDIPTGDSVEYPNSTKRGKTDQFKEVVDEEKNSTETSLFTGDEILGCITMFSLPFC
ncbi:hypothetical protein WG66_004990 [Moniliophthora roreri]|nr:hypothetical protein WG66_004990 [Moniliophthora roreri]